MQQPAQPILIADLFPEVLDALLDLLAGLSDDEWAAPTICPGWSVKDVAGHLLGDDIGMLARRRDSYRRGNAAIASWDLKYETIICVSAYVCSDAKKLPTGV